MIREYDGHTPRIDPSAYVFDNAVVIGKVVLGPGVSVWPGCVLRGDVEDIIVGENTNIQDGSIIHTNYDMPALIGKGVVIGHRAVLHGCKIGDRCLIGMGAVILDGASVGDDCIIAAGALVTENSRIPAGSVVFGVPGKVSRPITEDEKRKIAENAKEYLGFAAAHRRAAGKP